MQNTKQNEEIRNERLNNKKDNIGNPFNRIGAKNDIDKKRYQDTADFYNHLHKLGLKGAQNISSISKQAIDKAKQKKLN